MTRFVDAHCDRFLRNYLSSRRLITARSTPLPQVTGSLMKRGHLNLEVFTAFVPNSLVHEAEVVAGNMISEGKDWMRHEGIKLIEDRKDLLSLSEWDTAGVIGLEGASPLDSKPEKLRMFYANGVRVLTITWSRKNAFAWVSASTADLLIGEGNF